MLLWSEVRVSPMAAVCLVMALLWSCLFLFIPAVGCDFYGSCDSEIYCTGEILKQVQMTRLFDDDKHFVDMKLQKDPGEVLDAFRNLTSVSPGGSVHPAVLRDFIMEYFEPPGQEFEPWTPTDWHDGPQFLSKIADAELRSWAGKLHQLWKSLGRKIRLDVRDRPELYSLIYTPHPFIVPGGRFREIYYWDSYWVINGLLLSEMQDTAKGMIQNFLYLVDRYGFVPNGSRRYYERRSQPPFLALMVESYYQATGDEELLRNALPVLEREYEFWMSNRSLDVATEGHLNILNRYAVPVGQPRPESYSDDADLAKGLSADAQQQLYMELNSGAESGWDFSSRWYLAGPGQASLRDIGTSRIIPVDLNSVLCRVEGLLANFHRAVGDGASAGKYDKARERRLGAMETLLWDPQRGCWFDYELPSGTRRPAFYPSGLAPLWARCYSRPDMAEAALRYLEESGALLFPNGVPTSLVDSGQQWDLPNAWPPLQHMLIEGLSNMNISKAQDLAFDLAQRWIKTNWVVYKKYDAMFEKYNIDGDGQPGGGGEYEVQLGFGWTNGVALQLLDRYGDRLSGSPSLRPSISLGLFFVTLVMAM
uniref:Trehalase n=3 Tax=Paramormyrops kingsleyae TaxID=1676925 RepID=A0A3B3SUQ1_9TELE